MGDIFKLVKIQVFILLLFSICKFIQFFMWSDHYYNWVKTLLLSLPHFFETILGILVLTCIGLWFNTKKLGEKKLTPNVIYILALLATAVYVIVQELNHPIGENNGYDKNDVLFSIIGLAIGFTLIIFIRPKMQE